MFDPVRSEFESRLKRVVKMHARGLGFEAQGTLGRSHYNKRKHHVPIVTPVLTLIFGLYGFKTLIFHNLGASTYGEHLEQLHEAGGMRQVVAILMQPEPVTLGISRVLASFAS
jgi:hypothetical protein